jgi:hypothetical protein
MIMLVLIVNVVFVFLAMWFIASMGEDSDPKEGDRSEIVHRLTDDRAPDKKTNKEQGTI